MPSTDRNDLRRHGIEFTTFRERSGGNSKPYPDQSGNQGSNPESLLVALAGALRVGGAVNS